MNKHKQKDLLTICKHPNSRKTKALIKYVKKTASKDKNKFISNVKLSFLGEKVAWFRDNVHSEVAIPPDQFEVLIKKYIARFDDELEQIRLKHSIGSRKNRQHANREDRIAMVVKKETEEFNTCGMEVPDLLDTHQFQLTKSWNGELKYLQNLKLKRYSIKQLQELHAKACKRMATCIESKDTHIVT